MQRVVYIVVRELITNTYKWVPLREREAKGK